MYGIVGFEKQEVRFGDLVKVYPDMDQRPGMVKMEVVGVISAIDEDLNVVEVIADRLLWHTPHGTYTERAPAGAIYAASATGINPLVLVGQR